MINIGQIKFMDLAGLWILLGAAIGLGFGLLGINELARLKWTSGGFRWTFFQTWIMVCMRSAVFPTEGE
jgi:hypothetical protein